MCSVMMHKLLATVKFIFSIIQTMMVGYMMEENAWLNARVVEAKLLTLGKAGRWLGAQTKVERRWS